MSETTNLAGNPAYQLYPYQEVFLLDRRRFRIVNKSRQTGMSFVIGLEAITHCLSKFRYLALMVSASERQARKLLDDIKLLLDSNGIPYKGTKTEIEFEENGSKIVSLPNSPGSVRGYTASAIYIDEFAHFRGGTDKEMLAAIQPSISRGGRLTLISTPFGRRGKFYEIWTEGKNWSRHEIYWWDCPAYAPPGEDKYQTKWYKEMRPSYPEAEWKQEFECSFSDSGAPVFQEWSIRKAFTDAPDLEGPVAGHEYVDGWDLARKLDWTVGCTLDITDYVASINDEQPKPMILVAFERFQRKPWTFVQQRIISRQILYNSSALLDGTGVGDPVIETLLKAYGGRGPFEGFVVGSSGKSKTDLVQNLVLILERGLIKIPDGLMDTLIKELRAYTWDDKGILTDCVMSLALAVWKATNGRRRSRVAKARVA
jgi:phage FluMu gp28-like protein